MSESINREWRFYVIDMISFAEKAWYIPKD